MLPILGSIPATGQCHLSQDVPLGQLVSLDQRHWGTGNKEEDQPLNGPSHSGAEDWHAYAGCVSVCTRSKLASEQISSSFQREWLDPEGGSLNVRVGNGLAAISGITLGYWGVAHFETSRLPESCRRDRRRLGCPRAVRGPSRGGRARWGGPAC